MTTAAGNGTFGIKHPRLIRRKIHHSRLTRIQVYIHPERRNRKPVYPALSDDFQSDPFALLHGDRRRRECPVARLHFDRSPLFHHPAVHHIRSLLHHSLVHHPLPLHILILVRYALDLLRVLHLLHGPVLHFNGRGRRAARREKQEAEREMDRRETHTKKGKDGNIAHPKVHFPLMQKKSLGIWLLTLGLAFVFAYFGIDKLIHPLVWIGWIPLWMEGLLGLSRESWLLITGILECLFAILLLIPQRTIQRLGAALIALHLLAVLTQTGWNDIAVRDIGLLLSSLALLTLL